MKTLSKLTLATVLATGFFALSANAATPSSKAALVNSTIARPAVALVSGKAVETSAISSKSAKPAGASEQVAVSRTTQCSKPMDMASNTCTMHCQ